MHGATVILMDFYFIFSRHTTLSFHLFLFFPSFLDNRRGKKLAMMEPKPEPVEAPPSRFVHAFSSVVVTS